MDPSEIGECRVEIITSGDEQYVRIVRADPRIYVSDHVLELLDERFGHFGDGILTIHGIDGDVSYGLSHYDLYRRQFLGTRSA